VYRSLMDCNEHLVELSHLGVNSACSAEVEQLCKQVNCIELKFKHNGIWEVTQSGESEAHSTPSILPDVRAGQALLNGLLNSFEDHLDRLRKKDAQHA
jgi:hypothetical protein